MVKSTLAAIWIDSRKNESTSLEYEITRLKSKGHTSLFYKIVWDCGYKGVDFYNRIEYKIKIFKI